MHYSKTTQRFGKVFSSALLFGMFFMANGVVSATAALPEWSYDDSAGIGPSYWGMLLTSDSQLAYPTCGTGREQSPVNLVGSVFKHTGDLATRYDSWSLNVENNGHTIQVNMAPGSTLRIADETYYLQQFHFHAGSEHTIEGRHEPAEIHFVHMNSHGNLAVLGVFVEEAHTDVRNPALDAILALAPDEPGKTPITDNAVKAAALLPAKIINDFWYYRGSLTTPPCTEGVKWFVAQNHIHASHEQILELQALVQHHGIPNYRPTQPLNDRVLNTSVQ